MTKRKKKMVIPFKDKKKKKEALKKNLAVRKRINAKSLSLCVFNVIQYNLDPL